MRVSVDVGGTFTDVIVLNEDGRLRLEKVETTPTNPASGVLSGFQKADATPEEIDYFVHGTTLGINALLTRTGAKVAIVTTLGFRDVYDLARTDRVPMYDFKYRKPQSLVPRSLTFELNERLDFQGNVLTPFDQASATTVARRIQEEQVESVAVCFLHAYANPAHELAMATVLNEICPDVSVTLSHHLSREYREYERTSTAVIDAYVKPITRTYLQKLNDDLRSQGLRGQFLMTRSGGGAMTVASAQEQPVHLVLSGPAGGVIGASFLSNLIENKNLITIDMGGTSLDASLVVDGKPKVENEQHFQGLPMSIPTIDIHTIGAGGGSIAWIDDGDHLQVGPMSAGASPGPVCYDKGGIQPTFTDAALVVGYLDPANFLGGEIKLNMTKTKESLNAMANRLSTTSDDVAAGILRISEAKIAGAVREISIEQGYHPRDFAMLAYGGGGAFVAAAVARDLEIPRVIVPPGPANFSAFGMLGQSKK
ncbi:hydantoinase/oxoprolinase family protein [Chloroflexi bacterium TSY]|nr:hydantoinase/oxoprolinase family protein [Chloroflexi bacterium TSY]